MAGIADRRGGQRASLLQDVLIELPEGQVLATMLDLSVSGAAIWGPHPAPQDAMRITVELDDSSQFELEGVTVREYTSDGGSVWGVAFRGIDDGTRARLRAYVDQHA